MNWVVVSDFLTELSKNLKVETFFVVKIVGLVNIWVEKVNIFLAFIIEILGFIIGFEIKVDYF